MKGFGFFLGGVLLQALGFQHALWAMAGLLVLVLRRRGVCRCHP
jgi:hypothetical protein